MGNHKQSKVVFALTSQGNDFYAAMTRVAVASLRLSNPKLSLTVACDRETDVAVRSLRDPLLEEIDDWRVVDTPSGNAGYRNRYVKTCLSELIHEPFLFLDSDVFVRGDLSQIFRLDTDLAGARNHSQREVNRQIWYLDRAILETMGWTIGERAYLNGGVLFCNDTPAARKFWGEWHSRWLRSYDKLGNYRDQPALNSALHATQPRLTVLEERFNAQVKTNASAAKDAVIWHFYSDSHVPGYFDFDEIVNRLLKKGYLDLRRVEDLGKRREPWRRRFFLDEFVGNNISRKGHAEKWEITWLGGSRLQGTAMLLQDKLRTLAGKMLSQMAMTSSKK